MRTEYYNVDVVCGGILIIAKFKKKHEPQNFNRLIKISGKLT